MIRYLIIDDEHIAHRIIMEYCEMLPHMKLQKNCYSALEAIQYLNEHEVDLIFLDLNMPKLKGFDFLKTLQTPPITIVTTAYKEFALEGFNLNVIDYLLKPFSFERFLKAMNKVANSTPKVPLKGKSDTVSKSIFLRSGKKYTQVFVDTILYIEAAGNYTKVITTDEIIIIREKFSGVLATFADDNFLQVHKSFAVAKKHIKNIEENKIFIDEYSIPIAKTYKTNVKKLLK